MAKSRDEAADLAKQMQHLKDLRLKLEAQVSTMQAELVEARHDAEVLAGELKSAKELLRKDQTRREEEEEGPTDVSDV